MFECYTSVTCTHSLWLLFLSTSIVIWRPFKFPYKSMRSIIMIRCLRTLNVWNYENYREWAQRSKWFSATKSLTKMAVCMLFSFPLAICVGLLVPAGGEGESSESSSQASLLFLLPIDASFSDSKLPGPSPSPIFATRTKKTRKYNQVLVLFIENTILLKI